MRWIAMIDWVSVSLITTVMGVVNVGAYYTANLVENRWIEAHEMRDRKLK